MFKMESKYDDRDFEIYNVDINFNIDNDLNMKDRIYWKEICLTDYVINENQENTKSKLVFAKYKNVEVAVKIIQPNDIGYELLTETVILQRLKGKNKAFVKYYGYIRNEDYIEAIVFEYLEQDFEKWYNAILEDDNIDVNQWLKLCDNFLIQFLECLKELHNLGYYHGDIKTDNIMFKDNKVKLIDFGSTGSKYIFPKCGGTYRYLSAERLNGLKIPDYRKSDIYSFGFVIWELFNYPNYPFYQLDKDYIIENIKNNNLKENFNESMDDKYKMIMEKCWNYDIDKRITISDIIKLIKSD